MFRRSSWLPAFILLGICFLLISCSNDNSDPGAESRAKTTQPPKDLSPAYGDMIIRGSIGDASVLLPVLASDSGSFDITGLIFNGLVKYDKDIQLVPELAERWEISDDNLKIKFFLRKDVKWQDGKPFTSRDVEFTYKMYIDPKTPTAYASDFLKVKELKVIDDYTVEVIYDKPYAPALGSWGTAIHPAHLLEGQDITQSNLKREPIGTGPYKFSEWKTGERIMLDSYHNYFEGRPFIDRVLTRIIPDQATMFLELKAGKLDYTGLTPLQYTRQTQSKSFQEDFNKYKYLTFNYSYLGYNLKHPKFQDKRVRQALTYAINRQSLVDGVLFGLGKVTNAPYKPDTIWYNHSVNSYEYNLEKAKTLLAEVGWKPGKDGLLEKEGEPFEFTIITNQGNEVRKNTATIIQRDLKQVGIKVNIRVIEWAAFLKNFINKRNFEACLLGWGIGVDPNQMDIWHSSKTGERELNFISYQNPKVDELLELGVSTYDQAERKKYYDQIQEIISEDQPYTFLFVQDALTVIASRFHGIEPAPMGISYNFIKWYVPKPLQRYTIQE